MAFFGFLATKIDLLMVSFFGTAKDVGIYGVAYRITRQGIMLRNATAAAFFPIFVRRFHKSKMKGRRLIKYSLFFFGGIFVLSLGASFYAKEIVTFLFGSEYKNSGEILRVLIFYLTFAWMYLPFSTIIQATHNERIALKIGSLKAGLNIPLNIIFFYKFGLIGIAYSTLVVSGVGNLWGSVLIYSVLKKQGYLS